MTAGEWVPFKEIWRMQVGVDNVSRDGITHVCGD